MVGMLQTAVRRLLKQAHLERREKILGRTWTWPLFGQLVGIGKDVPKIKQEHSSLVTR